MVDWLKLTMKVRNNGKKILHEIKLDKNHVKKNFEKRNGKKPWMK